MHHNDRPGRRQSNLAHGRRGPIIARVTRRIHVADLQPGTLALPGPQAHHLRDVLRLTEADTVELFDSAGRTARARVVQIDRHAVRLEVAAPTPASGPARVVDVFTALPKGDRADWMIEKLSELGVTRVVPLRTGRSVVDSPGTNKFERWRRIAIESARQSERIGVMAIDPMLPLPAALAGATGRCVLCTSQQAAEPMAQVLAGAEETSVSLFIGPEGGWTEDEAALSADAGLTPARLTASILRVETAAVVAAACVLIQPNRPHPQAP